MTTYVTEDSGNDSRQIRDWADTTHQEAQLRDEPKKRPTRTRVAGVLCIRGEHFLLIGSPKAEPSAMKQAAKARRDRKRMAFLAAVVKFNREVQVKAALGIDVTAEWKELCEKFGERS